MLQVQLHKTMLVLLIVQLLLTKFQQNLDLVHQPLVLLLPTVVVVLQTQVVYLRNKFGSIDLVLLTHHHTLGNSQVQVQTIMPYHKTAVTHVANLNSMKNYQDVFIRQVLTNLVTLKLVTLLQRSTELVTLHLETKCRWTNLTL